MNEKCSEIKCKMENVEIESWLIKFGKRENPGETPEIPNSITDTVLPAKQLELRGAHRSLSI